MAQIQTVKIQYQDYLETYTAHIQKKWQQMDRMDTGNS